MLECLKQLGERSLVACEVPDLINVDSSSSLYDSTINNSWMCWMLRLGESVERLLRFIEEHDERL